jgi:hypothetical protein
MGVRVDVYDATSDGNVFLWLLERAAEVREKLVKRPDWPLKPKERKL